MKLIKQDLLDAGCMENHRTDAMLTHAQQISDEKQITDKHYLIKLLKRDFPEQFASLTMRENPAPLSLAIEATTKEETKNLSIALKQITELLRCPVVSAGTLMPDACPAGSAPASMPVGGAIVVENAIIPAAHSADICCSLYASFYHTEMPIAEQIDTLMKHTRFGSGGREKKHHIHHPVLDERVWGSPFLRGLETKAASHISDQGDGNHFCFIGEMKINDALLNTLREKGKEELADAISQRETWHVVITHHGSRSLGSTVFTRGLDAAVKYTRTHATGIPEEAAWLSMETKLGTDYWEALQYLSRWTKANHQSIHQHFLAEIGSDIAAQVGNEHNFVWQRGSQFFHGKGATPAWNDASENPLLGLIPLNMNAPILLTLGSNNTEHLSFSPHGAGRNQSRRALLRRYTRAKKKGFDQQLLEQDIEQGTEGLEVRWYQGRPDVTETPLGYKPAEKIKEHIAQYQLAEIIAEIKPLGSIMAGRAETYEKPLTPKQLRQMQHRKDRRKNNARDWIDEVED